MSYYARPMGDYKTYGYAGDPGFLSSLWRGIKKVALPLIGGAIAGPWGAAAGTAIGGSKPPGTAITLPGTVGGQVSFPGGTAVGLQFQPFTPARVPGRGRLPPFTATGPGVLPGGGITGAGCPSGYHLDKRTGTRCVRNRRMNVANPRALRRSMRRVSGFEKLARRTISFTRRTRMKKRKSS